MTVVCPRCGEPYGQVGHDHGRIVSCSRCGKSYKLPMGGDTAKTDEPTVLYIDRSQSTCGVCGFDADPYETAHFHKRGYASGPGCGAQWTHVSTHYVNIPGLDERIQEMRPDLVFIPLRLST